MNILNIVTAKVWGGGEQYVYDITHALAKTNNKMYTAVDDNNIYIQKNFDTVSQTVRVKLNLFAGLFALKYLITYIKRNDIELVCCHSGRAMILCMLIKFFTKVKLVFFKHNVMPSKMDFYHKFQRRYVDAFICVSKLVYKIQTNRLDKDETKKFHLVYNGIDITKFNNSVKKRPVVNTNNFVIGYAGRIASNKGLEILLEAFSNFALVHDDVKLLVAGSDQGGWLKKFLDLVKIKNISHKIEYIGQCDDMNEFYRSLSVFVLPSIVREAFGLVLCEAMYCQVPIITTNSGAQEEIVDNGINGIIVPTSNIQALTEALEKIYGNYETYRHNALEGKEKVERCFTSKRCAEELVKIFRNISTN